MPYFCIMKVDKAIVDKIAHLARLSFRDEEKERILDDMNKIIQFVDKLNDLDTEGVEDLSYINDDVNVLREDIIKDRISKQDGLSNAPLADSDYFKVPKVIDKK